MDPAGRRSIRNVFLEALEREGADRIRYLDSVCAGNEELRRKVEALLRASQDDDAESLHGRAGSLEGQVLGRYRLASRIGSGGMGEVWRAEDSSLGRPAAIKLLRTRFTSDADALRRFEREARSASALNHPNIITIYEIGETPPGWASAYFIATEFIEGETLRQRIGQGPIALPGAVDVAVQVASALQAAHRAGILHRDIKPENIMVRPDKVVKVLDFGLAKLISPESQDPNATHTMGGSQPRALLGTPSYMSPEQATGSAIDPRSDIFSLGIVLYEIVTGKPPFEGNSIAELFVSLLTKEPPPLSAAMPDAPEELEQVLAKALAKDRDQRYQNIGDMLDDLEGLKASLKVGRSSSVVRTRSSIALPRPPATPRTSKTRRPFAVLAVLAAVSAIGIGAYLWMGNTGRNTPAPTVTPLTSFPGEKDYASFSPDGSQAAFVWNGGREEGGANPNVYIKVAGPGEPLRLTRSPEREYLPAWSPDGTQIAFIRDVHPDQARAAYVVPALGGQERKIADVSFGLSWFPNGEMLAIATPATAETPAEIAVLNVKTGEQRRITSPQRPEFDQQPVVSPDGNEIAFLRSTSNSARDIFIVPASGGKPRQLTTEKRPIFGMAWTADGRQLVYAATRAAGRGLWSIPSAGGEVQRVVVDGHNPTWPAISRRGDRLAYTESYSDSNLYSFEGPGFNGKPAPGRFGEPQPIASSTREDTSPEFSPDGRQMVFTSQRTGSEEVWVCNRDGSGLIQITRFGGSPVGTPRWSPDGKWIAFDSRAAGSPDVYVMSAMGADLRKLTNELSFDSKPSWSRDGKWIYFCSDRGGRSEIWKVPFEGGNAVQVTHTGAFEGFESPDGKLFYFSKNRGEPGLWSVPVNGASGVEEKPVAELAGAGYWRSWGVMNQGIYFAQKREARKNAVLFFSFATRQIVPLAAPAREPVWNEPGLALSPDGRQIVYAQVDHTVNDILLMDHFR